ncbi:hypothetical protein ACG10_22930 (plasmid) [Azotobacter chroococcum]|nr:hypothetical protein [Azotobacter chroococcum]ASL29122.1 hypothetical protein ACG10_22930 [Azotobacter chroococcum]
MRYKIDCMRGPGHEDGTISPNEVELRRFDAVIYRRYFDAAHTVPDTSPLVVADINEPPWDRRIPGCVLYADPGERLFIHVYNADAEPHSFHVHGLDYGIDSDGSFPFGVADHHTIAAMQSALAKAGATCSMSPPTRSAPGHSTTTS